MKNYTITVNGNVYDVVVEEGSLAAGARVAVPAPAPVVAAPVTPAPVAAPVATPAPVAPAASGTAGGIQITAGAAGKVFRIEAPVGQAVKSGDSIVVVEAMKMEIPMVAPQDGVVASINVTVGDSVEAGTVLATLN